MTLNLTYDQLEVDLIKNFGSPVESFSGEKIWHLVEDISLRMQPRHHFHGLRSDDQSYLLAEWTEIAEPYLKAAWRDRTLALHKPVVIDGVERCGVCLEFNYSPAVEAYDSVEYPCETAIALGGQYESEGN